MVEIVGNLYEMEGVSKVGLVDVEAGLETKELLSQDTALERATAVFALLDVNDDGELNEDEFVEGCLKDQNLINLLNSETCSENRVLTTEQMIGGKFTYIVIIYFENGMCKKYLKFSLSFDLIAVLGGIQWMRNKRQMGKDDSFNKALFSEVIR